MSQRVSYYVALSKELFKSGILSCSPEVIDADDFTPLLMDAKNDLKEKHEENSTDIEALVDRSDVQLVDIVKTDVDELGQAMVRIGILGADDPIVAIVLFGYDDTKYDVGYVIGGCDSSQYYFINTDRAEPVIMSTDIEEEGEHYAVDMLGIRDRMCIVLLRENIRKRKAIEIEIEQPTVQVKVEIEDPKGSSKKKRAVRPKRSDKK